MKYLIATLVVVLTVSSAFAEDPTNVIRDPGVSRIGTNPLAEKKVSYNGESYVLTQTDIIGLESWLAIQMVDFVEGEPFEVSGAEMFCNFVAEERKKDEKRYASVTCRVD